MIFEFSLFNFIFIGGIFTFFIYNMVFRKQVSRIINFNLKYALFNLCLVLMCKMGWWI